MDYTNLTLDQDVNENGLIFELGSLYTYLERVSDSRKPKGKLYSLVSLLVLMLRAKLSGEDKPSGRVDWVAHRVEPLYGMKIFLQKRAPSHMTYRRVLQSAISATEFEQLICEYHRDCLTAQQELVLSMDGKHYGAPSRPVKSGATTS